MKFTVTSSLLSLSLLITFALSSVTKEESRQALSDDTLTTEQRINLWNTLAVEDQIEYLEIIYNKKVDLRREQMLADFDRSAKDKKFPYEDRFQYWKTLQNSFPYGLTDDMKKKLCEKLSEKKQEIEHTKDLQKKEFRQAMFNDALTAEELTNLWNRLASEDKNEDLKREYNRCLGKKLILAHFNSIAKDEKYSSAELTQCWNILPDAHKDDMKKKLYEEALAEKRAAEKQQEIERKKGLQNKEQPQTSENAILGDTSPKKVYESRVSVVKTIIKYILSLTPQISNEELERDAKGWSQFFKNSLHGAWNHKGKILTVAGLIYAYKKGYLTKENLQTLKDMIAHNSIQLYESATKENMQQVTTYAGHAVQSGYNQALSFLQSSQNFLGQAYSRRMN